MDAKQLADLFKVDNPGRHAHIDVVPPDWFDVVPDWQGHLDGKVSLCIPPIGKDDTCYWGAIDFDAKAEESPEIPVDLILQMIKAHNMPLNLYRSKGGKGAHGYIFMDEAIPAQTMIDTLALYTRFFWPYLDSLHDMEIFPKQATLGTGNGSCIRIPYYGNQVPLFEGDPVKTSLVTVPPCLCQLPEKGNRNDYMYHMSIYLRHHGLKDVNTLMKLINENLGDNKLPEQEVISTSESGRRQYMRKTKMGFGLGCAVCPDQRKNNCKFASEVASKEMDDFMEVSVVHYLSEKAKIRMTIGEAQETFDREAAFDLHTVKTAFVLDHGVTGFPKMKAAEWKNRLMDQLEKAPRETVREPGDIGHYIIDLLRRWSESFEMGIENIHSGKPTFINDREFMVIPQDFLQYINQKNIKGITKDDIYNTLGKAGSIIRTISPPAIKLPVSLLEIKGMPNVPPTTVNDMKEDDVEFIPGPVVRIMNKMGVELKPTDECLRRNPWIQKKIIEATQANMPDVKF